MDFAIIIIYSILGALLSEIDRMEDENKKRHDLEPIAIAIITALLMGYMIVTDLPSAILFTAILLGVFFGGKVDNLPFLIGMLILSGAILIRVLYTDFLAYFMLSLSLAGTAFMDEYGHDKIRKMKDSLMRWFFAHRFTFKFGAFIIAYYDLISIYHFAGILAFDFFYELNKSRF